MDELVQQMVAAGWIGEGDVDDGYQEYLRRKPFDADAMTYAEWQAAKQNLLAYAAHYAAEIEPLYRAMKPGDSLTTKQKERERFLLGQMDYYEALLGY